MRCIERAVAAAAALVTLSACGVASGDQRIELKVLAASSLTDAFTELGAAYQVTHRRVGVQFEFDGSQDLAAEVKDRDPADVLATADEITMSSVEDKVTTPHAFAHDTLTIAVAPGNPRHIRGPADLANPRLRVSLGGPPVPVGRYAVQMLTKAGVTVRPRSEEADARTVLTRVRTGVADAGVVYMTDIRSAGVSVSSVPIPPVQNALATYFAAAVRRSDHVAAAREFAAWLRSAQAQTIMRTYGFLP